MSGLRKISPSAFTLLILLFTSLILLQAQALAGGGTAQDNGLTTTEIREEVDGPHYSEVDEASLGAQGSEPTPPTPDLSIASVKEIYERYGYPGISPSPAYTGATLRVRDYSSPMPSSPATGGRKILVILIDFPDWVGTKNHSYYQKLLFGEGEGSVRHYYREVSYGQLTAEGTVAGTGWYRSAHNMTWWGADDSGLDDANGDLFELAREAVVKADADVDFKAYDADDDGFLEPEELCLCIVHAGKAQEAAGSSPSDIWSHYHWIYGEGYQASNGSDLADTYVDEVRISQHYPADYIGGYTMQAEDSPLGTFAHEFGHHLGLPDLYDLDGVTEFIGKWDLMGKGNWNGLGASPAHLSSWSKIKLGWIAPSSMATVDANQAVNVTIDQLETSSGGILAVNITADSTYYLVEVRQKTLYDSRLPEDGVLILYCNDTKEDGEGPVRLQYAHPSTSTLDDAAFDVGVGENQTFTDSVRGITITVLQAQASSYIVKVNYNASTLKILTDPTGLLVEVDGTNYTTPQTFTWATGSSHTVYAPTLKSGGEGTRYHFRDWSDGGAQKHTVVVGASDVTLTANYGTQHFLNVTSPYGNATGSGWYDSGSTAYAGLDVNVVSGGSGVRHRFSYWSGDASGTDYNRSEAIVLDGAKSAVARWKTQYKVSLAFKSADGLTEISPGQCQVSGASPNGTLVTVEEFSNLWLDDVRWTAVQVLWQGSNVVPDGEVFSPKGPSTWVMSCRIYAVDFSDAFRDSRGGVLPENPSNFSLLCPNGTETEGLPVGAYYLQNGTFEWQFIMWRGHNVAPLPAATFDAADGDPRVECAIFNLTVNVRDYFGLPLSSVEVDIVSPSGRSTVASTTTDAAGRALFSQLPRGDFNVEVPLLGFRTKQTVFLEGSKTVELRVFISPAMLGLFTGGLVLMVGVVVFVGLRRRSLART